MNQLNYASTSTDSISTAIELIRPAVAGIDGDTTAMACLAIAIFLQKPDIGLESLMTLVRSTSEFIALNVLDGPKSVN